MTILNESATAAIRNGLEKCFMALPLKMRTAIMDGLINLHKEANGKQITAFKELMLDVVDNKGEWTTQQVIRKIEIGNEMSRNSWHLNELRGLKSKYCGTA